MYPSVRCAHGGRYAPWAAFEAILRSHAQKGIKRSCIVPRRRRRHSGVYLGSLRSRYARLRRAPRDFLGKSRFSRLSCSCLGFQHSPHKTSILPTISHTNTVLAIRMFRFTRIFHFDSISILITFSFFVVHLYCNFCFILILCCFVSWILFFISFSFLWYNCTVILILFLCFKIVKIF